MRLLRALILLALSTGPVPATAAAATLSVRVVGPDGVSPGGPVYVAAVPEGFPPREPLAEQLLPASPGGDVPLEVPPGRYRILCASPEGGHAVAGPVVVDAGGGTAVCALPRLVRRCLHVTVEGELPVEGAEVVPVTLFGPDRARRWSETGEEVLRAAYGGRTGPDGTVCLAGVEATVQSYVLRAEGLALAVSPAVRFQAASRPAISVEMQPGGVLDVALELPPSWRTDPPLLALLPIAGPGGTRTDLPGPARLWIRRPDVTGHALWEDAPEGLYQLLARRADTDLFLATVAVEARGYRSAEVRLADVRVVGPVLGLPEGWEAPTSITAECAPELVEASWHAPGEGGDPPRLEFSAHFAARYAIAAERGGHTLFLGSVAVPPGAEGTLSTEFRVPPAALEVAVIRSADGAPATGASVAVAPVEGDPSLAFGFAWGTTGGDGMVRFHGFPAATVRVTARAEGTGCASRELSLDPGSNRVTLELHPCGSVEGSVLPEGGGPVEGLRVVLAPGNTPTLLLETTTDREGRFHLSDVPPGPAVVFAARARPELAPAVAFLDVPRGGTVAEPLRQSRSANLVLVPPSGLHDAAWARFVLEDHAVPWRALRRVVTTLLPLPPSTGFLSGAPPGRWRVEWLDAAGQPVARSRPFRIEPGESRLLVLEEEQ